MGRIANAAVELCSAMPSLLINVWNKSYAKQHNVSRMVIAILIALFLLFLDQKFW